MCYQKRTYDMMSTCDKCLNAIPDVSADYARNIVITDIFPQVASIHPRKHTSAMMKVETHKRRRGRRAAATWNDSDKYKDKDGKKWGLGRKGEGGWRKGRGEGRGARHAQTFTLWCSWNSLCPSLSCAILVEGMPKTEMTSKPL
ncbi:uncharacterized protein BJ212DRAFT_1389576 [Suillus subaureus]|uniref:Uncharacterized protein n=1 Tax=Suillus subaureus TaxID=48587 RepID=A0A9P7DXX1_9AGAM|nr:uncharacterized protein BJ212DRAFT_1389576 [Suillus subaureus]KAG1806106.1 hypothetical protein BJ212DRAFT_1389576 [Suillus subaureus]